MLFDLKRFWKGEIRDFTETSVGQDEFRSQARRARAGQDVPNVSLCSPAHSATSFFLPAPKGHQKLNRSPGSGSEPRVVCSSTSGVRHSAQPEPFTSLSDGEASSQHRIPARSKFCSCARGFLPEPVFGGNRVASCVLGALRFVGSSICLRRIY
jgi:hypothetical protein